MYFVVLLCVLGYHNIVCFKRILNEELKIFSWSYNDDMDLSRILVFVTIILSIIVFWFSNEVVIELFAYMYGLCRFVGDRVEHFIIDGKCVVC